VEILDFLLWCAASSGEGACKREIIVSLVANKGRHLDAILQGWDMDLPCKLACWRKGSNALVEGLATELRNEQADEGLCRSSLESDRHIFCLLELPMVGPEQVCMI
jgi:hypothetical protein